VEVLPGVGVHVRTLESGQLFALAFIAPAKPALPPIPVNIEHNAKIKKLNVDIGAEGYK